MPECDTSTERPHVLDFNLIEKCLADVLPEVGSDASDWNKFLASEILEYQAVCTVSSAGLESIVASHLINLGFCQTEIEATLICEDIHKRLVTPASSSETEIEEFEPGECCMCRRAPMPLTLHHLRPKKVHKMLVKRHGLSREDLERGILICRQCHSAIHKALDHESLGTEYFTLERLLSHEAIRRWALYASKQKVVGLKHGLCHKR